MPHMLIYTFFWCKIFEKGGISVEKNAFLMKATEIYLLLFATVHLLYFGFSGYAHIFDAKQVTFCTINLLYLLCIAVSPIIFTGEKTVLSKRLSPAHIFAVLYMLFTVISGILSEHFPKTFFGVSRFEGIFTICIYCLTFIAVSAFSCRKRYIFVVFSIAVTLFSLVCVIQLFGYNPLSLYPAGTNFYDAGVIFTTAFIGTLGNTNLSGAFICIAFPFLLVMMLKAKGKSRFLLLIPLLLLSFSVLKMGVDSTILGLVAGFIICFPALLNFGKRKAIIFYIILAVIILAFLVFIYCNAPSEGMLHEISEILHGNIDESFGSGRIRIWKNVISEIPDSPILGKGPDTMQEEKFPPFERFYPARNKVMRAGIDVAHNEFLNILYHQGVLGLLAYSGFVFFVLRAWYKNRNDALILALGSSVICYLVQSFFTFSMCISAPYFWICAALIVGLSEEK